MPKNTEELSLKVSIRDRREVLFNGEVKSVSLVNSIGDFDVLPTHANFISLITDKIIINKNSSDSREFPVESGLINVDESGVSIYIGVGNRGVSGDLRRKR